MDGAAQDLPKKTLPDRVRRELRTGETIYHSAIPCHVSSKYPEGKWIAQVRRVDGRKLVKYPVRGFGTPSEALAYIKTLRPDAAGRVNVVRPGEPTVAMLYEYVCCQRQKRITETTKTGKESRWRLHIEPEWGHCPISQVTRRAAQEWVTTVEQRIERGEAGTLGLGQFEKVRTDLHSLFESLGSFAPEYEDRKNPFSGLDFSPRPPRHKVTLESQYFPAIHLACHCLAAEGLCTEWIAQMFLTALLAGLREGEVLGLCRDQLDFKNGAILVDRAMRRKSRAIDRRTRLEGGEVLRQAMHLPKRGNAINNKTRLVPMSKQLADILRPVASTNSTTRAEWDLLWPGETGKIKEIMRFRRAWETLRSRLHEIATLAPIEGDGEWPAVPKRQGWQRNPIVDAARQNPVLRLPNLFGEIDFRDTRNSFASYMNEVGISQASREHILGHSGGNPLTNTVYTVVTSGAFQDARRRLTRGWKVLSYVF